MLGASLDHLLCASETKISKKFAGDSGFIYCLGFVEHSRILRGLRRNLDELSDEDAVFLSIT